MNALKRLWLKKMAVSGTGTSFKFDAIQRLKSCMAVNDDVIFEQKNHTATITLNRSKSLNALSLSMIRSIYPQIKKFDEDASLKLIIMKGAGEKAFCAGGDVIAIANAGKKGDSLTRLFFKEEYTLNHTIGTLKTPFVAFIDGITMGGGVGLSIHGRFRVATERTLFAMPETAIGFFPDVGGGYILPRLTGNLGIFLALTGHRLKGRDVFHAGLATHYVQSDLIPTLESRLASLCNPDLCSISNTLNEFHDKCISNYESFSLDDHRDRIKRIFGSHSVGQIVRNLEEDDTEWSHAQLKIMRKMSPLSLCVALRQLTLGASLSFPDVLKMEYRISQKFMENPDFYEGIRAVLVDKDNQPSWSQTSVEEVLEQDVDSYFAALDNENELFL